MINWLFGFELADHLYPELINKMEIEFLSNSYLIKIFDFNIGSTGLPQKAGE